jgi:hypothetical protein
VSNALDALWGSQLVGFEFDAVTHDCRLLLHLVDGERDPVESDHVVICRGVKELRFFNEIPLPWNYADVTEIEATYRQHTHDWEVELVLWSEEARLTLRCASIAVDGEPLG